MNLSVVVDGQGFSGSMARIQRVFDYRSTTRIVSRAADRGSTFAQRKIREEYNVTAAVARGAFSVRMQGTAGVISARGRRGRNVALFLRGSRGRPKRGRRAPLQFEIRRGRRVTIPGTFLVSYNGGRFVAERTGPGRLPIKSVRTIDIPGMFGARRVLNATIKQIQEVFLKDQIIREFNKAVKAR